MNRFIQQGAKFTSNFKQYLKLPNHNAGSYFHDIQLRNFENISNKNIVNMVVEVPRWSNAKFEISKSIPLNPIVQDTKKGKLRFVNNIFPYHGYIHNYGAIPQTWEDPTLAIASMDNLKGDNDPLDMCEIGNTGILSTGDIVQVKVLGSLALIDDGELDWKIIGINIKDPLANVVNDLNDVAENFPGLLAATKTWFRDYKIPSGKPKNKFFGDYKNVDETIQVIENCHKAWQALINNYDIIDYTDKPWINNSTNNTGFNDIQDTRLPDAPIDPSINTWCYLK
ncbi:related to Inorganic pyrophosphatase, mitochondrial [Saccharomycodes ludwigii]|uniref:inorganic diphosphatase n=1 Tax=Saccharomycodes ludwigii TaxID=36035 RepID=A0A376B2L2_9ASCO|nr:related to Inorganic pyrophosphatase, mitochondrial [Saccharomycodes ludwigii]